MEISVALHIVSLVFFLGGMLIVTRFLAFFSDEIESSPKQVTFASKMFFLIIVPGFVGLLLTGLYQLSYRGLKFYAPQAWFHVKFLLVVVLFVLALMLMFDLLALKKGKAPSKKKMSMLHGFTGLIMIVIIFLTEFGVS